MVFLDWALREAVPSRPFVVEFETIEAEVFLASHELGCVSRKFTGVVTADGGDERWESGIVTGLVPDDHRGLKFIGGYICLCSLPVENHTQSCISRVHQLNDAIARV